MSHTALRRVMVRMLHDPAFTAAVYAAPEATLADVDLTATERAWLTAEPRAAWATDPDRPARVLAALRDEFPVSSARAPARTAGFFASPAFHRAVQERGSLALALGEHLAADPDPAIAALATLESAIARVRRAPRTLQPSAPGTLRRSPAAAVVHVPVGTLARYHPRPAGDAPAADDAEHLLGIRTPATGEVTVEDIPTPLALLLDSAGAPTSRDDLLATARRLGADPGEDADIVDQLVADGLLS